jgi:hypothetical protein
VKSGPEQKKQKQENQKQNQRQKQTKQKAFLLGGHLFAPLARRASPLAPLAVYRFSTPAPCLTLLLNSSPLPHTASQLQPLASHSFLFFSTKRVFLFFVARQKI